MAAPRPGIRPGLLALLLLVCVAAVVEEDENYTLASDEVVEAAALPPLTTTEPPPAAARRAAAATTTLEAAANAPAPPATTAEPAATTPAAATTSEAPATTAPAAADTSEAPATTTPPAATTSEAAAAAPAATAPAAPATGSPGTEPAAQPVAAPPETLTPAPSEAPPGPARPGPEPLPQRLAEAVRRIEAGEAPDEFYWGKDLGPHHGSWTTMPGKVAGCLLHKAEAIAMEHDLPLNASHTTHEHLHFFRNLCLDLAACCAQRTQRGWCIQEAGPVYARLAPMAEQEDHGHSDGSEFQVMAWAFAGLARAAGALLRESGEDCSPRGKQLLSACPQGPEECTTAALERLRQQLLTA